MNISYYLLAIIFLLVALAFEHISKLNYKTKYEELKYWSNIDLEDLK